MHGSYGTESVIRATSDENLIYSITRALVIGGELRLIQLGYTTNKKQKILIPK